MQKGKVKRSTVFSYFKACNLFLMAVYLLINVLMNVVIVSSNFWLSKWTNDFKNDQADKIYNFGIYVAFGFGSCKTTQLDPVINDLHIHVFFSQIFLRHFQLYGRLLVHLDVYQGGQQNAQVLAIFHSQVQHGVL